MRYRRLSHRYAVLLTTGQPRQFGEPIRLEQFGVRLAQTKWRPPADVYESEQALAITVELAGVEPEELDLQLFDDALVVEGKRVLPPIDPEGIFHAAELRQGPFRLEIPLFAAIDPERFSAEYDRGLLRVVFAKSQSR
jgi:HSP20 family protein